MLRLPNYISTNTHIPKGSTDSTGIRESKTTRYREREREEVTERETKGRQAGVAMATLATICRHRIQFGMRRWRPRRLEQRSASPLHFQPKPKSSRRAEAKRSFIPIVLRACCLLFAFNGFDLGIPTPWHCRSSTWESPNWTELNWAAPHWAEPS